MELLDVHTKFLYQGPWFWLHLGLAKVSWLNNDIQAIPHKKLEIAMSQNNPNQGGQQNQQGGQGGGQQGGGQQKPGQQQQQPGQKPGQGGQQGGQQK
jgi:hypothetical protein